MVIRTSKQLLKEVLFSGCNKEDFAMPLVIITGIPSSGKTRTAIQIQEFFERQKGKKVILISELNEAKSKSRNDIFKDSTKEKVLRGEFKSDILRSLNKEDLIIADGSNYIKGFRYELYCATKSYKTPQITVHCDVSPPDAKELNAHRDSEDSKYSDEIFDALSCAMRRPSTPIDGRVIHYKIYNPPYKEYC
ncbi:KTI12 -like protein [Caligus rogercresseyi]|uniref:Protein KTI12 homolog n=1 Tax=Caligus rogercresseyi TaxID=217165 RepID=A0A7T8QUX3_CALRO|nr:KTI12 -like protein [Caligus rogercresseyi]